MFARRHALLLHALCGKAVHLQARGQSTTDEETPRPILTQTHLLLPADAEPCAAVAHAAAHLLYSPAALPVATLKPMSLAVISAVEDARVEHLLLREYPGLRKLFLAQLRASLRARELNFAAFISRLDLALLDPGYQDDSYWVNKARELFAAQAARDLRDYAAFRQIASILANDLGQMRMRFFPQQYAPPATYRDDNSFLWNHDTQAAAPLELDMTGDGKATAAKTAESAELHRVLYPEWDYRLTLHREDWCTVIEKTARDTLTAVPVEAAPKLRRPHRLSVKPRLRRQEEGEEIDVDAAIEAVLDRRAGRTADTRLFHGRGRERAGAHYLVLLDLSASANDRVAGTACSILDIEKKTALMLAQSAMEAGDRIAVHGFSSNGRAEINYYRLLDFGKPLDATAATRIQAVEGRYSTRMGTALRHAASCLRRDGARQATILLLSDGVPADVDVHNARYLVEDARVAVKEGSKTGILTYGIGIGADNEDYLRRIFGRRSFVIVKDPQRLPAQVMAVYTRLTTA